MIQQLFSDLYLTVFFNSAKLQQNSANSFFQCKVQIHIYNTQILKLIGNIRRVEEKLLFVANCKLRSKNIYPRYLHEAQRSQRIGGAQSIRGFLWTRRLQSDAICGTWRETRLKNHPPEINTPVRVDSGSAKYVAAPGIRRV